MMSALFWSWDMLIHIESKGLTDSFSALYICIIYAYIAIVHHMLYVELIQSYRVLFLFIGTCMYKQSNSSATIVFCCVITGDSEECC